MNEHDHPIDNVLTNILDVPVPSEVDERLKTQLATFRTSLITKQEIKAERFFSHKRMMFVGPAAAAVLCTAVGMFWVLRPQTSFANVIAAIQQLPWVHVSIVDPSGAKRDVWYSTAQDISASRNKDWLEYYDHKLKIFYSYDVRENVLYRVPEIIPRRANHYTQLAEALRLVLKDERTAEKPSKDLGFFGPEASDMRLVNQTCRRVNEGGKQWLEYRLTVRHAQLPDPMQLVFQVDPATMLPHSVRVEGKYQGEFVETRQQIDYPETGPTSVYDLGASWTAKMIDRIPSDDITRIMETLRAGRTRMDDYRALVVNNMEGFDYDRWNSEFPMVLYRKGDKTRVDFVCGPSPFPPAEKPAAGEDIEQWWRKRAKDFIFWPVYITHGSTQYDIKVKAQQNSAGVIQHKVEAVNKRANNPDPGGPIPPYYSRSPEFVCRPPLGIPQQALEPIIEKDPPGGPSGTILLRIANSGRTPGTTDSTDKKLSGLADVYRFWLDPKRDYAALRWDMVGTGENGQEEILSSYIIEDLKQSPRGIWYATRFRVKAVPPVEHDQVFDIYIDFDEKLPDSLFEPPAVGQVIH